VKILDLRITIPLPDWLYDSAVFVMLLYRRLRYGYRFRRIPLSQGRFAIVDPADYNRLAVYNWYAVRKHFCFYAQRHAQPHEKPPAVIKMHRQILTAPASLFVDHINRNGLDNRKQNLRLATPAQNSRNARWRNLRNKTSIYKGVSFSKRRKKFRACITVNRKTIHVGFFNNQKDAARAYDTAAKKYHGPFAYLNFK